MPRRITVLHRAVLAALLLCASSAHPAPVAETAASYPNTSSFGVPFATHEDWYRQCMRVARLPLPHTPEAAKMPANCDATDLYYRRRDQKHTSAAEWREVAACARASGDDAVLMMLYANGFGQPRDPERALRHACRLDSAKAEMEGRVSYLASLTPQGDGQAFDLCDHVTSEYMRSVCAGLRDMRVARAYAARLDRFADALPSRARRPFARLREAADAFVKQSATEFDLSGADAAVLALDHAAQRRDELVQAVFDTAAGKIPRATAEEFAQLDAQLNAHFRKLMTAPPASGPASKRIGNSTIARADVRSTEQAWLAYRDAWTAYLAASSTRVDRVSMASMLTRQRIAQLKRL